MTSNPDVSLEPFSAEHVSKTFGWVSDADFQKQFLMRGAPTWEGHQAYCRRILEDSTQRGFAIIVNGDHVGNCGLKNLTVSDGELWFYIGDPEYRRRGIGQLATALLIREGFDALKLERIYLHVADFNIAARKLYEKLGFQEIRMQKHIGEWSDRGCRVILMEVIK